MKRQRFGFGIVVLATGLLCGAAAFAQKTTAEALFREALMKERAEGNLPEAIFRYERLIAEFAKDRQFAAQALYRLALAYEKLGDPRAKLMLTRLSRDYAGMEPYASNARARLAQQASAPAGPFPEITLDKDYELGSPDGKLVIYHKSPSDWGRAYVKELATGKERLLLDHPGKSVSNFAWSPDSQQLAYNFMDEAAKVNDIRAVRLASGETTSLSLPGYPLAWTGTAEIFFYRPNYPAGGADYWMAPAKGGTPRKVYFGSGTFGAMATPDGTRLITYMASKPGKLAVLDLATGEERPLTAGAGDEARPLVSPDSRLVSFAANPDGNWAFYVAPLDQGLPVKAPLKVAEVKEPGLGIGWGGQQWWTLPGLLTYRVARSESNIYRLEMDPKAGRAVGAPVRLTQDATLNLIPSVSPDGKHIAYWYGQGTKRGLAMMDSDGANERPLFDNRAILGLHWLSPEEILFYCSNPKDGGKSAIHALNTNTGVLQRLAQVQGLYWHYVPSRKEILHLGAPSPGTVLKAYSLVEGKERVVARMDYLTFYLAVSPDGKQIAYATSRPVEGSTQRVNEMALMTINGEPERTLIAGQSEIVLPAAWSPDGKYLLYGEQKKGPRVMNVQTRESWPLHKDLADANWNWVGGPRGSWSPDGAFVVIGRNSPDRVERMAWEGVTTEAVARLLEGKQ